ncbi:hypothetical protein ACQ4LE_010945 [Meloidogyne hapla]|uniref:CRF domain-containing protein n=1 Tax=Meloidogyne hapla TaxID=6305 RepID=A0A1I8C0F2_MELHA
MLFILYVSFLALTQTEAIRGALFRTGRSADEEISPQIMGITNNAYNSHLPGNCPEEEDEEQLLSMASHPSLMVDLRQLLKFSRERALAEEIARELSEPSPISINKLAKESTENNQYKSKRMANVRRAYVPWKSPRLAAYIALFRNANKNHPISH